MLLADVLVEARQVADDFAPAVVVGEMAEGPVFGSFAMSAQVRRTDAVAVFSEFFRQIRIATTVFGHAVGQQNHCLETAFWQPLVNEEAAMVARGQPERIVDHCGSFAWGCRIGNSSLHFIAHPASGV
ncbi:hypothetical protein D3C84_638880 [compost metagenome]